MVVWGFSLGGRCVFLVFLKVNQLFLPSLKSTFEAILLCNVQKQTGVLWTVTDFPVVLAVGFASWRDDLSWLAARTRVSSKHGLPCCSPTFLLCPSSYRAAQRHTN